MASLIQNLNSILSTKEEIKTILGTENEVFSDYPTLISAAIAGGGGITPEGTYTINSNGTYDVTSYAYAYVSISSAAGISISSASIATDMQYPSMNVMTEGVDSFSYTFSDSDVASGTLNVYLEASIGGNTYYTGGFFTVSQVSADGNYSETGTCNMESSISGFSFAWSDYGTGWTGTISNVSVSISKNVGMNGFVMGIQYTISNYSEITPGPTPSEKNGRYLVTFGDPMAPTEVFEQFTQNPMDGTYDVNSMYGGACEIRDYSMDVLTDTWKPSIDTILDPALNIDFNSSVELGNASTGNLTISSGYNLHMEVQNDHPYIWYDNSSPTPVGKDGTYLVVYDDDPMTPSETDYQMNLDSMTGVYDTTISLGGSVRIETWTQGTLMSTYKPTTNATLDTSMNYDYNTGISMDPSGMATLTVPSNTSVYFGDPNMSGMKVWGSVFTPPTPTPTGKDGWYIKAYQSSSSEDWDLFIPMTETYAGSGIFTATFNNNMEPGFTTSFVIDNYSNDSLVASYGADFDAGTINDYPSSEQCLTLVADEYPGEIGLADGSTGELYFNNASYACWYVASLGV